MTRKRAGISKGMLLVGGLLAGLTFLFLVPRDATGRLQHTYARVFRWPLAAGSGLTRIARTTAQEQTVSPGEYNKLYQAYEQFRNASANFQKQLQDAQSQIAKLTKLQARPGLEHMRPVPAKVITQGKDELTIDRGQDSGVAVGQCVLSLTDTRLDDQCVIGIVSRVYRDGAKVKLITDRKCAIPATIGQLNAKMVLEGRGDGTARIPLVLYSTAIKTGDIVYARGQPGFLDAPVILGEVAQCERDLETPTMWDITVRPACDLTTLGDVVVMKPASIQ